MYPHIVSAVFTVRMSHSLEETVAEAGDYL